MSLPAGEQQVLDRIAETLRASEPRLASMFAIFGRLFKNEGPPLRERLPTARPFARLGARRHRLLSGRSSSVRDTRSRSASAQNRRRSWQLVFVFANMVAAVVLVAVLIATNTHAARTCTQRSSPSAPVFVFRGGTCPAQAGSGPSASQK
jgi:hypothetical protein